MKKELPPNKLERLLLAGFCEETEDPLQLLMFYAFNETTLMFKHLKDIIKSTNSNMFIPGLAALLGQCTNEFREKNFYAIKELLKICQVDELLMLTEFCKSKIFGRGLGAYSQKLIRRTLEDWSKLDLETSLHLFPHELSCLVKMIHPRFSDPERSKIIKELFNQSST